MSRYKVYVTPHALKETQDLPGHIRQRVKRAVKALADNPRLSGSKDLDVPDLEKSIRLSVPTRCVRHAHHIAV